MNHYVEVTEEIESEVRGIMLENEEYLRQVKGAAKTEAKKMAEEMAEEMAKAKAEEMAEEMAEAKAEAEVERTRFSTISYLLNQNKTGNEVIKELAAMQGISEEEARHYYNKYIQVR